MSKLSQLKEIKKEAIKEILGDTSTSKLTKLETITNEKLWEIDTYINNEFGDWEEECNLKEKAAAIADGKVDGQDYICSMTDTIFDPSVIYHEKYERIYYVNEIKTLMEDYGYGSEDEATIDVVTSRGDYQSVVTKSIQEVIDRICDYCFENETIGFNLDW